MRVELQIFCDTVFDDVGAGIHLYVRCHERFWFRCVADRLVDCLFARDGFNLGLDSEGLLWSVDCVLEVFLQMRLADFGFAS